MSGNADLFNEVNSATSQAINIWSETVESELKRRTERLGITNKILSGEYALSCYKTFDQNNSQTIMNYMYSIDENNWIPLMTAFLSTSFDGTRMTINANFL